MKFKKTISAFSAFIILGASTMLAGCAFNEQNLQGQEIEQKIVATERYKTLSSVSMILERENNNKIEVLLQQRKNTGWMDGMWGFGACGHVDEGENVVHAAIRETKEEIGVDVFPKDMEFVQVGHDNLGEKGVYYNFYFKVKNYTGEVSIMEPEKCADLKWFDINELPENMIPNQRNALENYHDGIVFGQFGWE